MRVVALGATGLVSGAERVLLRYAAYGEAHDDEWLIMSPIGPLATEAHERGLRHAAIPELKLGNGRRLWAIAALVVRNVQAARKLHRALRDTDIILVNSLMALPVAVVARTLRFRPMGRRPPPVVWLVHDVVTRGDLRRIATLASSRISRAFPVSEAAAVLPRQLGIDTIVVPNGIALPPPAIDTDASVPTIGVCGVLTPWKGQDVFLDALALVPGRWRAEILGGTMPKDTEYEVRLRARSAQPDLDGRVSLLGHVNDPLDVMRKWTIAISASREPEAAPLAVLEAMSLGLAVVVTDHGGGPEVLGECGIKVPPDDPVHMAAAIERYLADPLLRADSGRAARVRIGDVYDSTSCSDWFTTSLRGAAATPPGGNDSKTAR